MTVDREQLDKAKRLSLSVIFFVLSGPGKLCTKPDLGIGEALSSRVEFGTVK
jgi:hypothetical protein